MRTRKERSRLVAMIATLVAIAVLVGVAALCQHGAGERGGDKASLGSNQVPSGIEKGESDASARFEERLFSFEGYEVVGTSELHGIVALHRDAGEDTGQEAVVQTMAQVVSDMEAGGWTVVALQEGEGMAIATFGRSGAGGSDEGARSAPSEFTEEQAGSAIITVQEAAEGISVLIQMY